MDSLGFGQELFPVYDALTALPRLSALAIFQGTIAYMLSLREAPPVPTSGASAAIMAIFLLAGWLGMSKRSAQWVRPVAKRAWKH